MATLHRLQLLSRRSEPCSATPTSGLQHRRAATATLATPGLDQQRGVGGRRPDRHGERADLTLKANGAPTKGVGSADERTRYRKSSCASTSRFRRGLEEILAATAPDAADVDTLGESVHPKASHTSARQPQQVINLRLRREAVRRIRQGAARPHELQELYLAAGRASGVLVTWTPDLGEAEAAQAHARTAHSQTCRYRRRRRTRRAWGTLNRITHRPFQKDYSRADLLIQDGLKYAGPGTSTVRLLCGAAQCAANNGDFRNCPEPTK